MSDQTPYTPSLEEVRRAYCETTDSIGYVTYGTEERAEFDRLIAHVRAETLREASSAYGLAQVSGFFLGPEGYTKAWLDARADRIEQGETDD